MGQTSLNPQDIYDPNASVTITIPTGLTDLQMQLILAHEFWHLSLYEISRNAGSYNQLLIDNPDLAGNIRWKPNMNNAHHDYMVSGIEEYESVLRSAYPGQSEEFYEYGKWGGGIEDEMAAIKAIGITEVVKAQVWLKGQGLRY